MSCRTCSTVVGASVVTVVERIIYLGLFAEVFVMEDVGGCCGSGGVSAFIRCRAWTAGGRRGVVVVAAREHWTSNGGEA